VVEEELAEADAEEREAAEAQGAPVAGEPDVQESEPERSPQSADAGVAALEVGVQARGRDAHRQLEYRERRGMDEEDAGRPERHSPPLLVERRCGPTEGRDR